MSDQTETTFLTTREAARDMRIGLSTLYRLIQSGTITPTKIGGATRIARSQITALATQ